MKPLSVAQVLEVFHRYLELTTILIMASLTSLTLSGERLSTHVDMNRILPLKGDLQQLVDMNRRHALKHDLQQLVEEQTNYKTSAHIVMKLTLPNFDKIAKE